MQYQNSTLADRKAAGYTKRAQLDKDGGLLPTIGAVNAKKAAAKKAASKKVKADEAKVEEAE